MAEGSDLNFHLESTCNQGEGSCRSITICFLVYGNSPCYPVQAKLGAGYLEQHLGLTGPITSDPLKKAVCMGLERKICLAEL